MYAMAYSPADKALWSSSLVHPGYIIRLAPGSSRRIPRSPRSTRSRSRYGIRGMDVDRNGVAWLPLDSGHLAASTAVNARGRSTGRAPRRARNAPRGSRSTRSRAGLSGRSRRRGEPVLRLGGLVQYPGPWGKRAVRDRQPVGFAACPRRGQIVELRVPYPMGFFTKGLEAASTTRKPAGKAASCGRLPATAPRSTSRDRRPRPGAPGATPETRSSPLVVEFQLRPDPLAH